MHIYIYVRAILTVLNPLHPGFCFTSAFNRLAYTTRPRPNDDRLFYPPSSLSTTHMEGKGKGSARKGPNYAFYRHFPFQIFPGLSGALHNRFARAPRLLRAGSTAPPALTGGFKLQPARIRRCLDYRHEPVFLGILLGGMARVFARPGCCREVSSALRFPGI